ncbi:MAG: M67 family metallopeptidase [Deltaproteobacteria bacterium]|nr:M67 family metallopeptidase [Deltaproteobacteria bacterium]
MVKLTKAIFDKIIEDSKNAYPHECCGALLGNADGDEKSVSTARLLQNMNKERAADRYEIDPAELLKVEKEGAKEGLDVVGFYHSHPDHPSKPSGFDRERAWPDYSYIIVAVAGGTEVEAESWTFTEMDAPFEVEEIKITD